ncbi:RHOMBOID-like protein 10, chloroplastic isoform X2 [Pistacia vera]|uniref:RHOMBOID-like protein 10, chloroplastic isoform X2 n=1 Tax=Pistacia vera TaxID=55513 RepID=UPI001262FCD4|nr:RHOMBOID-like protein 10, chloroplastic isoform X2 [Pistacia vera]
MDSGRGFSFSHHHPLFLPTNLTTTTTPFLCLRLAHHFRLRSSFKKLFRLCNASRLKDLCSQMPFQFNGIDFFQFRNGAHPSQWLPCLCFFTGGDYRSNSGNEGILRSKMSTRNSWNGRQWTNALLAVNVLIYIAQMASKGKLMLWGAKINSLINKGEFWRLVTSSFLHANVAHLMVNCYSLNSIGPTMESICGPRRYLAVYFSSAIASSAMSYWFSKPPAVGASGAIFGLVGSLAGFVTRHRGISGRGREDLQHIAQVIGLLFEGIDNWGHLGGLLGGTAVSWLLGPAWKYVSTTHDGSRIFSDRAHFSTSSTVIESLVSSN